MLKLLISLYILVNSFVSSEICGNVSQGNCFCKTLVDEKRHSPVFIADCSSRNIDRVPSQLGNVNFLDVSFNNIQTLDPKQNKLNSTKLHNLILKYNKINSINDEFFTTIPHLKELDLSYNSLETIDSPQVFQNLIHLERLDLTGNLLKHLPSSIFSPLHHIRFLYLSYNPMGKFLMGSKNVLVADLGLSNNLTHLKTEGMGITELHNAFFDDFKKMSCLSLADNNFTIIPSLPTTLEKLDLSGNKLSEISAHYLNFRTLKVLKLNRMDTLTQIHHYAFYNLESLEKLYIEDCPRLHEFSYLAFDLPSKNTRLHPKHLSLARNGLTYLNESYQFFFKDMDFVDLTNNPWECDCDILWLKVFDYILHKPHEMKCHSPNSLRNKRLLELKEEEQIECYPHIYGKQSHRVLIVVLSVALVILCGLIFVLLRYPINSIITNNRIVGPASPYNLASTSDRV